MRQCAIRFRFDTSIRRVNIGQTVTSHRNLILRSYRNVGALYHVNIIPAVGHFDALSKMSIQRPCTRKANADHVYSYMAKVGWRKGKFTHLMLSIPKSP